MALANEVRTGQSREVLPPQALEETGAECRARADLYRLLSAAFVEEPGRGYLRALRSRAGLAALSELGLNLDADFTEPGLDELADRLACEYTALFVSPGGFPCVESVRLTGRFQQEPYYAVRALYQSAGVEVQKGRFAVFDDHLGIELSFVAVLLERAVSALEREDLDGFRGIDKEIKRFWASHLGRWVRGYAGLVQRAAEHSFYREMAQLLKEFAEDELTRMGLRLEDTDGGRVSVPKSAVSVALNSDEPVCRGCELGEIDSEVSSGKDER